MKDIIFYLMVIINLHYVLVYMIKIHNRFRFEKGTLTILYKWDYINNTFYKGRCFRILPRFFFTKRWTFFYKGWRVCSCQFIDAYTRSGSIRKLKKKYDITKFNLNRLRHEFQDDPAPDSIC
jgi:hypothetical protein